nr:hypothetical protein YJOPZNRJ_YJOPZNRJ_CDS_0003 [Microvirus sp.]
MKDEIKAPLFTLIKAVVSALIVFGSTVLGQLLGSDGSALAVLGASVGTSVLVS